MKKINIVAATQWSNQPHGYLSFMEHIEDHHKEKCLNILYPHWGYELEYYPRTESVEEAKELSKRWDIIMGHHSHVPGPITEYDKKLVVYSLGDSSTGMPRRRYRKGKVVTLEIGEDEKGHMKLIGGMWSNTKLVRSHNTYFLSEDKSL